jgi:D-3-phosphoglycerate dehydrogenase / 2-oxoglutarate reductase
VAVKQRVLISSFYERRAVAAALRRLSAHAEMVVCDEGRTLADLELLAYLPGIDAVIAAEERYDEKTFEAAPDLAMIARDGVGLDSIDLDAATRHGVIVNTAPVVHESVADLTLGLIIAAVRKMRIGDAGVRSGAWNRRDRYLSPDVNGMTLGLLGFGNVGKAVARRAAAFDMTLLVADPYVDVAAVRDMGVEPVSFGALLSRADVISLHAPLTPETRNILNAKAIAQMKDGAFVVNTSRGGLIDEPALVEALASGKLSGAGLDVVRDEPPPADNPLFHLENVVLTPHVGSDTTGTFAKVFESAVTDILMLFSGEKPGHIVNPKAVKHPRWAGVRWK